MKWSLVFCTLSFIFFVSQGCSPSPVKLSPNFGESVDMAVRNQILVPEAQENLTPVENLDGVASKNSIDLYRKSFKKPKKAPQRSLILSTVSGN